MDDVVVGEDPAVRDRKRAEVYERWLELARDDDFIGVQNYERIPYDGDGQVPPSEGAEVNQMGSEIEPLSLAGAVRYAHEATAVPSSSRARHEHRRRPAASRVHRALAGRMLEAMTRACRCWATATGRLLDNFEWVFGYGHQLGLHEVDREDLRRTPKPSAGVYAAIVKAHGSRG